LQQYDHHSGDMSAKPWPEYKQWSDQFGEPIEPNSHFQDYAWKKMKPPLKGPGIGCDSK
jgi:hypothetical protein